MSLLLQWNLICDRKWISQTITTIQMAGLLAGALFWGHVSDGIGRKPTFYLNVLLLGTFNLVSYFSVSWVMFAAMRCGIGLSCAGFMVSVVSFEYIRNKWRVYLYLVPGWAIWASLMALFCWKIPDWHYIHIVITVMSVMILLTWRYVGRKPFKIIQEISISMISSLYLKIQQFSSHIAVNENLLNFKQLERNYFKPKYANLSE